MPLTESAGDADATTAGSRSRRIVLVGTTIVAAALLLGVGAWRLG